MFNCQHLVENLDLASYPIDEELQYILQMLITTTEEDLAQDENESPKKKDKDKKYHWNHGSKLSKHCQKR